MTERTAADSAKPADYLIAAGGRLLAALARFDAPADAVLVQWRRDHPKLGARDRQRAADAAFAALRHWPLMQHWLAASTAPADPRRAGLLAFGLALHTPFPCPVLHRHAAALLSDVLTWSQPGAEQQWLEQCLLAHRAADTAPLAPALQHGLPQWLAQRLSGQLGESDFVALTQALRQPAPLDLRVNLLGHKRAAVQQALRQDGIETTLTPWSPWGLRVAGRAALREHPLMQAGAIEVQDEGSQLLALLSNARRNEIVVDFCAGGGGKTLAMGAMMRNTGRLYAFDTSAHRLDALQPRLQRSGLGNVHTMALSSEHDPRLQRLQGRADRVLVDAPCSGTGTLRRHPELAWRTSAADIDALQRVQSSILLAAARLLKPGGTLIYATCSLLQQENTEVQQAFAAASAAAFEPLDWQPVLKKNALEHLRADPHTGNSLAFSPHIHQTDGFFIAGFRKKAG